MNEVVWGVDTALKGIAIVAVDGDEVDITWWPPDKKTRDQWTRVTQLGQAVRDYAEARTTAPDTEPAILQAPRAVFIEAPVFSPRQGGKQTIINTEVFAVAKLAFNHYGLPAFDVPVSTWKLAICAHGRAKKEEVQQAVDVFLPKFAEQLGALQIPKAFHEDVYDAAAVALYGRKLLREMGAQRAA